MAAVQLTKQTLSDILKVTTLMERTFVPCASDGNIITIDDRSFFEIRNEDTVGHTVSFATKPENWGGSATACFYYSSRQDLNFRFTNYLF